MKKLLGLRLYQALLSTIVFFVALITITGAQSNTDSQIIVLATVLPERSIIVDSDLTIQKIYSNTLREVRPNVYQDTISGPIVAYTESIQEQYEELSHSIDYSKPGLVYVRPSNQFTSFLRTISNFFKNLLG